MRISPVGPAQPDSFRDVGRIHAMQIFQIIAVFLPFVIGIAVLVWWQHVRADEILQRWARAAGLALVSAQKRYLRTGPFFMDHFPGQLVFRIVACDPTGAERAGWLRVGSRLGGVLSDKTKVIWD